MDLLGKELARDNFLETQIPPPITAQWRFGSGPLRRSGTPRRVELFTVRTSRSAHEILKASQSEQPRACRRFRNNTHRKSD